MWIHLAIVMSIYIFEIRRYRLGGTDHLCETGQSKLVPRPPDATAQTEVTNFRANHDTWHS